eukprot:6737399-Pyramimonas_sp.AAC.1
MAELTRSHQYKPFNSRSETRFAVGWCDSFQGPPPFSLSSSSTSSSSSLLTISSALPHPVISLLHATAPHIVVSCHIVIVSAPNPSSVPKVPEFCGTPNTGRVSCDVS